jgi:hypothetical protein
MLVETKLQWENWFDSGAGGSVNKSKETMVFIVDDQSSK